MKKSLKLLGLMSAMTLTLTGCKNSASVSHTTTSTDITDTIEPAPHTHDYDEGVVTKEATCTEDGVKTFTCECGDTYTEVIPATGHSYDEGVTSDPTATKDSVTTYTCSVCGDTYEEVVPDTHTGEDLPVGLAYISSALLSNLTGKDVYDPDYMFANMVHYEASVDIYWFGVSFGSSASTETLQSFVSEILSAYDYVELQGMTPADGDYYGFYLDTGVKDIYEDTIVYEVDCYVSSNGSTALQVLAAYAPYFMSEE